jgi:prepilin-type N-terminal cleavage/methylation domain-containing protein
MKLASLARVVPPCRPPSTVTGGDRDSTDPPAQRRRSRPPAASAFTLVELLVVIGIIAVLIAVLLPVLGRARESANQVKCLSNMRQICVAMINYAGDSKGVMPASGGSSAALSNAADPTSSYDWIAWQRKKDPVLNRNTGGADQNITYGALAKYLGTKQVVHTTPDEANTINPAAEAIFRCPSDAFETRVNGDPTKGWYRYSHDARSVAEEDHAATPRRAAFVARLRG